MSDVVWRDGHEVLVRSQNDESSGFSYLSVIDKVDSLPVDFEQSEHFQRNVYILQTHTGVAVGFVLRLVVNQIIELASDLILELFDINDSLRTIRFKPERFETRDELMEVLFQRLKLRSTLECISTWRDEKYAVYVDHEPYILVERGLASAFGIVTYGIHVNGYIRDQKTGKLQFWIPRRSATKSTWPSKLDNIVAGGIGYPHGIYETVLKECMEEASLTMQDIKRCIKPVGNVSYLCFQAGVDAEKFEKESSTITGEVEYLYDLELPENVKPVPNDGEVEHFKLLSLQETVNAIMKNEFKPNCALVMVEFLIRHGYINPENEPNYTELISRMHRRLPFPVMR